MDPEMTGRATMRWVADRTLSTGGYYVFKETSAHYHKGQTRLLAPPAATGCTHAHVIGGRCSWCLTRGLDDTAP